MPARNEMDPKYQWDFTHMYASDAVWEAELERCVKDLDRIAAVARGVQGGYRYGL